MKIQKTYKDTPQLIIIPTPIGNLEDITLRALRMLQEIDLLLCEDTRVSKKLLEHYQIKTKLMKFNDHSKQEDINHIITLLQQGLKIGLVSDAGCPCIADPGFKLINACYKQQIVIEVLPGANAALTALIGSNIARESFQFIGFLKQQQKALQTQLLNINNYPGISIIYEAPHKLLKTLQHLHNNLDNPYFCIARELTKIYEEYLWGDYQEIINYYKTNPLKGEIIILVYNKEVDKEYDDQKIINLVNEEIKLGSLKKEAIKKVAKLVNKEKQYVYNLMLKDKND